MPGGTLGELMVGRQCVVSLYAIPIPHAHCYSCVPCSQLALHTFSIPIPTLWEEGGGRCLFFRGKPVCSVIFSTSVSPSPMISPNLHSLPSSHPSFLSTGEEVFAVKHACKHAMVPYLWRRKLRQGRSHSVGMNETCGLWEKVEKTKGQASGGLAMWWKKMGSETVMCVAC